MSLQLILGYTLIIGGSSAMGALLWPEIKTAYTKWRASNITEERFTPDPVKVALGIMEEKEARRQAHIAAMQLQVRVMESALAYTKSHSDALASAGLSFTTDKLTTLTVRFGGKALTCGIYQYAAEIQQSWGLEYIRYETYPDFTGDELAKLILSKLITDVMK